MSNQKIKIKHYKIKIKVLTGIHIGAGNEEIEIGGVDNKIIRTYWKRNGEIEKVPYIPGSSIKGKVRSFIEKEKGWYKKDGKIYNKQNILNELNKFENKDERKKFISFYKFFGVGASDVKINQNEQRKISEEDIKEVQSLGVSREIFSDLYPTPETLEWWKDKDDLFEYAEVKSENTIDRKRGTANPRSQERIPAGSEFVGVITLQIFPEDKEYETEIENWIESVKKILNNTYIGGSGTRGYGRIKAEITECDKEDFEECYN